MATKTALFVLIAVLFSGMIGYALGAKKDAEHTMPSAMDAMTEDLEGKEGAAFDKAFLEGMIVHHEGAVAMAEAALLHAEHQEVKTMAHAIIAAQTLEITQMRTWLSLWFSEGDEHSSH